MDTLKNKLRISVIVVTFNRANMLRDALVSLTGQTRSPEEVIVVDNDSGDTTKDVVFQFKNSLNVRYVLEKTRGIPSARNTGIKTSTGDIIVFMDDDCVADKEWLHYLELPFLRDPSIGIVGGEILAYRTKGNIVEEYCIADAMMRVGKGMHKEDL
jgi:glycosyltransferase involved in cell wall biosynthesis